MAVTRMSDSNAASWLGKAVKLNAQGEVAVWSDPSEEPYGIVQQVISTIQVRVATQGDPVWALAGVNLTTAASLLTAVGAAGSLGPAEAEQWHVAQMVHPTSVTSGNPVAVVVHIGRPLDDGLLGGLL